MTKKLQDLLDLPDIEDLDDVEESSPPITREELMVEATELVSALTVSEKIDAALITVSGLEEHDGNMDDIAERALKTYEALCSLGLNIADPHTGKIYEVAGQMLKVALEAKDSKIKRKLDMIELQIRKMRVDKVPNADGSGGDNPPGVQFDRNELLKHITSTKEVSETVEIPPEED